MSQQAGPKGFDKPHGCITRTRRMSGATVAMVIVSACGGGASVTSDATAADVDQHVADARLLTDVRMHADGPRARDAVAFRDAAADTIDAVATRDAVADTVDAVATRDASPDATLHPDAAPPPPTCPGGRNVFTLTQSHPGGPLGNLTTTTLSNLDALWNVATSPLDITAAPGSGASASLSVTVPYGATLTPGTYPQGSGLRDGGPAVDLLAGNECEQTSGTFTLASLTNDDAGVASMLATFSLACATGPGQTDEVSGCVRYQADSSPVDAAVVTPEAGYDAGLAHVGDAGALAPCLGFPQAFYVTGSPLAGAPETITGADGDGRVRKTASRR